MTVGEKIKAQRKAMRLTQTELGEKLGVQKNAVSKWECGRVTDIPRSKLQAMAALFGVSTAYLIDDEVPAAPEVGEFICAMQNEAKHLTYEDKQILLSLARRLNSAREHN